MSDLTVGIHDTWTVIHISVGKHDTWTISDLTVGTVSILWSVFAGVAILVFVVNLVDVQFKSPKAFYSKYIARDVCGAIIWLASNTEMFCKRNPSTVCREKKIPEISTRVLIRLKYMYYCDIMNAERHNLLLF